MSAMPSLPVLGEQNFRQLQQLMQDASGIHLSSNKRSLVAGRLLKRLRHFELDSYDDYLNRLTHPQYARERRLVVDLLTTNETYFFREHAHFEYLGQWLRGRSGPLRLWSAACSSGEEPYSMAMTVAEYARGNEWSILASDLSLSMLGLAEQGIYDMAQARYFPDGWLHRHCLCGIEDMQGRLRVQAWLRAKVQLREINVVQPLPENIGQFDVIFLRNLLIYFDTAQKQRIVRNLTGRLRPGGLLFIGHAESIHGFNLPLRPVRPSVFERL